MMEWKANIIQKTDTFYVALPPSYVKAKGIHRDQIAVFVLNQDGSLNLRMSGKAASSLMEWKVNVRRVTNSHYIALPPSYVKAKGIHRDQIAVFVLNQDGSLNLRVRDPVMNIRRD